MIENIKNITKRGYLVHTIQEYIILVILAVTLVGLTVGSHKIGIPLYKINPMHWVVYFLLLYKKQSIYSVIFLGFLLPLSSTLITGHPILLKSLIMGIELSIYGLIFKSIFNSFPKHVLSAFILSQLIGRIVYYTLKYQLIKRELLDGILFASDVILQVSIFILLGISLSVVVNIEKK